MSSLSSYENLVFPWEGREVFQVQEEQEAESRRAAKALSSQGLWPSHATLPAVRLGGPLTYAAVTAGIGHKSLFPREVAR